MAKDSVFRTGVRVSMDGEEPPPPPPASHSFQVPVMQLLFRVQHPQAQKHGAIETPSWWMKLGRYTSFSEHEDGSVDDAPGIMALFLGALSTFAAIFLWLKGAFSTHGYLFPLFLWVLIVSGVFLSLQLKFKIEEEKSGERLIPNKRVLPNTVILLLGLPISPLLLLFNTFALVVWLLQGKRWHAASWNKHRLRALYEKELHILKEELEQNERFGYEQLNSDASNVEVANKRVWRTHGKEMAEFSTTMSDIDQERRVFKEEVAAARRELATMQQDVEAILGIFEDPSEGAQSLCRSAEYRLMAHHQAFMERVGRIKEVSTPGPKNTTIPSASAEPLPKTARSIDTAHDIDRVSDPEKHQAALKREHK